MPSLRVVNLSKTGIRSLPPSLFKLTEFQALFLGLCNCLDELPPEVGNLGALEVLDLEGSALFNLPYLVGKLGSLRRLQVSSYESFDKKEYDMLPHYLVSRDTISKLLKLQKLHIVALDVSSLNQLTSIQLYFPNVYVLYKFIDKSQPCVSNSLSKFKFIVGQNIKRIRSRVPVDIEFDYDQQDRCLKIVNIVDGPETVFCVLGHATAIYQDNYRMIRSLAEFRLTEMKELKFCIPS